MVYLTLDGLVFPNRISSESKPYTDRRIAPYTNQEVDFESLNDSWWRPISRKESLGDLWTLWSREAICKSRMASSGGIPASR